MNDVLNYDFQPQIFQKRTLEACIYSISGFNLMTQVFYGQLSFLVSGSRLCWGCYVFNSPTF